MKKIIENDWTGTLTGHTEKINDYDFSTDGEFIVSASDDRKVKIPGNHSFLRSGMKASGTVNAGYMRKFSRKR